AADSAAPGRRLFAYAAGLFLTMAATLMTEHSFPNQQHQRLFYVIAGCVFPLILVGAATASRLRWGATVTAATYTGVLAGMVWALPLFPATPKLAPIYNPVDHMVPPAFPLLLLAPAFVLDLLLPAVRRRDAWWRDLLAAALLGAVFLAVFLPVQWAFSGFLISPAADTWFFAGNRCWSYGDRLGEWRYRFHGPAWHPLEAGNELLGAVGLAAASAWAGLRGGRWMARVVR
ncbi:MAG: hypothetical protein HZA54_16510, partial [Planctomycetes bacterium]|nr:hypothetical protein [Planctomycetota bacterium]